MADCINSALEFTQLAISLSIVNIIIQTFNTIDCNTNCNPNNIPFIAVPIPIPISTNNGNNSGIMANNATAAPAIVTIISSAYVAIY